MGEDAIKVLILLFAKVKKVFMVRLRFRNEGIARVTGLSARHMFDYKRELSDRAIRRFIRRVGADNIDNLIRLRKADDLAQGGEDRSMVMI
ncbi:MAG: hypothetical protein HWN71_08670 [Desulfobacterales bacterium]|nr:hypothetical protein [Desulfobacterales bacterium]